MRRYLFIVGALIAVSITTFAEDNPERWEETIAAFEAQDQEHPPEPGGMLFLGSSSIRMWDLEEWFPDMHVLNRGFGGSQISDSIHYFDRVVAPYEPSAIVFYAGDNDVAVGKPAARVAGDFETFSGKMWAALPETEIYFIGIKPSTARWELYPEMKKANEAVAAQAAEEPRLTYVDIEDAMLGEDGIPRKDLLLKDGLHMTDEGYRIWTELVKAALEVEG